MPVASARLTLGPVSGAADFYAEPTRMQHIKTLLHLAEFTNKILALEGPAGAGKTTLLARLRADLPEHWRVCHLPAVTGMGVPAIRQGLLGALSLGGDTIGDDDVLLGHLQGIRDSDLVACLIIDDADLLGANVLRQLAMWSRPDGGALHILLAGVGMRGKLLEALHQEVDLAALRIIELTPFSEEQTAEYLHHRATALGENAAAMFDDATLKRVYRVSHGWPGKINEALAQTETDTALMSWRKPAIVAGAAIALSLAGAALITWKMTATPPATPSANTPTVPLPLAVSSGQIARQILEAPTLIPLTAEPKPGTDGFFDAAWLRAKPPDHYTLHLVSAPTLDKAKAMLPAQLPPGEFAIVELRVNDKPQFVVLLGDFADHDSATAARNALPAHLKKRKPWVRTVGDLEKSLAN